MNGGSDGRALFGIRSARHNGLQKVFFHLLYRDFLNRALVMPKRVTDLMEGPYLGSGVLDNRFQLPLNDSVGGC